LVGGHPIKQSPRASPDLCTPLAVTLGIFCGRKDKAFGEHPFALHRQQPEKDTIFIRLLADLDCNHTKWC